MKLDAYGIKEGLIPNGGVWYYDQPFKDDIARIEGDEPDALVDAVTRFRACNGIAHGNPAFDISEFIKKISPSNNKFPGVDYAEQAPRIRSKRPIIEAMTEWILSTTPKRPKLLMEYEADERTEICAKCPQNIVWKSGCAPCNEEVLYRTATLRQKATYKHDDLLRACRLHGLPLQAAVFCSPEAMPERSSQAPENCWIK